MAKAVFTTKVTPSYDDLPESRYHFPGTYLNQARAAVGDHIIYYEPRRPTAEDSSRGGRQAYFATARVETVIEDTRAPGHFYALIADYLDFDRPVPFADGGVYYESALRKADGSTNRGAFGRAVRLIPDAEFDRILKAGFAPDLAAERSEARRPAARFRRYSAGLRTADGRADRFTAVSRPGVQALGALGLRKSLGAGFGAQRIGLVRYGSLAVRSRFAFRRRRLSGSGRREARAERGCRPAESGSTHQRAGRSEIMSASAFSAVSSG